MSQKKAKIINKFLKASGMNETGKAWTDGNGKFHTLRDSKRIKRQYAGADHRRKMVLSKTMLLITKHNETKKT